MNIGNFRRNVECSIQEYKRALLPSLQILPVNSWFHLRGDWVIEEGEEKEKSEREREREGQRETARERESQVRAIKSIKSKSTPTHT